MSARQHRCCAIFLLLCSLHIASALQALAAHRHHHLQANEFTAKDDPERPEKPVQQPDIPTKVPHILHYIYLSGFDAYVAETEKPRAKMQRWYHESCVDVHRHWKIIFWTEEMAEELVRTHYEWFMPTWKSYDMEVSLADGAKVVSSDFQEAGSSILTPFALWQVKRADALRCFILHHHGGMYLDLDNECYKPAEEAFKQYDVVLQGTGFEGVNNGMMASAPGHPLWLALAKTLEERAGGAYPSRCRVTAIFVCISRRACAECLPLTQAFLLSCRQHN